MTKMIQRDGISVYSTGGAGMISQTIATSGGPHPAGKWGIVTTNEILDLIKIEDGHTTEILRAIQGKMALRPQLEAFLAAHYQAVQADERRKVRSLAARLEPSAHVQASVPDLDGIFARSYFAAHFGQPHVRAHIHRILGQHTVDVMHIERRYHADNNRTED
jgi:hypothetical protein